jgi:hypothetical protein
VRAAVARGGAQVGVVAAGGEVERGPVGHLLKSSTAGGRLAGGFSRR